MNKYEDEQLNIFYFVTNTYDFATTAIANLGVCAPNVPI